MVEFRFRSQDEAHHHFLEVPEVPRPAGASTQWLSFLYRSSGLQRHSPASHFAVVLRAELGRDQNGIPQTISGRGLTLGDTSKAALPASFPGAPAQRFGGARGVQVESFWPGGNFLFREARILDQGLRDDCDYRVHLHVNDDRWIGFWLSDSQGQPRAATQACIQDHPDHPVLPGRSGIVIALGRGEERGGEWEASFREITWGWF